MAGVQGNDLIKLCQDVFTMAQNGEYENGGCAFCSDEINPETFPFCGFCAAYPTQVEGTKVAFIKLYNSVTGGGIVTIEPSNVQPQSQEYKDNAWKAWYEFQDSIGEEHSYGTMTMEEYMVKFPVEWNTYQQKL